MAITFVGSASDSSGSNTNDLTLTLPSHQADDFAVIVAYCDEDAATMSISTPASGWTELRSDAEATWRHRSGWVWYRKFTSGSETTPVVSIDTSEEHAASIHIFRGVDTSTPFDVTETKASGQNDSTPTNAAITTVTDNCALILTSYVQQNEVSVVGLPTTPSSLTAGEDTLSYHNQFHCVAYKLDVGSSGTITPTAWTHTVSASTAEYLNYTIALRPAGTDETVVVAAATSADAAVPAISAIGAGAGITLGSAVTAAAAVPAISAIGAGAGITLGSAVTASAAVPTPAAITAGAGVTLGGAVSASAAVPAPSAIGAGAGITIASAVSAAAAVPTPSSIGAGAGIALGAAASATAAVPAVSVVLGADVVLGSAVSAAAAVPTPSAISVGVGITLGGAVVAQAAVPAPTPFTYSTTYDARTTRFAANVHQFRRVEKNGSYQLVLVAIDQSQMTQPLVGEQASRNFVTNGPVDAGLVDAVASPWWGALGQGAIGTLKTALDAELTAAGLVESATAPETSGHARYSSRVAV